MEAFCNEIIEEIRAAESEKELIAVIGNSMLLLRKQRHSFNEAGYILNMIASLRAIQSTGVHTPQVREMITLAIDIFRQLQKERREQIF
jgi:hypothetical protein